MYMWFLKILVKFFMSIDKTLFNFIGTLYDLLIAISRTSVLTQGDIAQFAARIEILLGIFMLFKLSFSLITYIVNPDDFTDKQKGFGKLVQNAVISLTMLVLVPYAFQMAFNLQAKVLNDNLLAKLLLGEKLMNVDESTSSDGKSETDTLIDDAGEQLSFLVMLPIFSPNFSLGGLESCASLYDADGNFNSECQQALEKVAPDDNEKILNYVHGVENESLGLTFRMSLALVETGDNFIIDYKFPISTAIAVITCLLLITFCIDIGIRSVKLAFLQLIYPIPVISFMDPKSGKDGIFSKWYKMCLSTFLSLFIRLLALYFGIYVIVRVGRHGMVDIINGSEVTNGWVKLFIAIGILVFVKQMPKILENLGIKLDGDGTFNLNPLKKVFDEKNGVFGAKQIKRAGVAAGAAGLAGAAAMGANALSGAQRFKNAEGFKNKSKALLGGTGSMLAGGLSGLTRGLRSGLKGEKFGKAYSNSYSTAMKNKQARSDRKEDEVGWGEMMASKAQQKLGMHTQGERDKAKIEALSKMVKLKDQATNIADKSDSTIKGLLRQKEALSKIDPQSLVKDEIKDKNGNVIQNAFTREDALKEISQQMKTLDDQIDDARASYFENQANESGSAISSIYAQMQDIAAKYKDDIDAAFERTGNKGVTYDSFGANQIKEAGTAAINAQQAFEQSSGARHSQDVDKYGTKKDAK